jgi:hypothetical protein
MHRAVDGAVWRISDRSNGNSYFLKFILPDYLLRYDTLAVFGAVNQAAEMGLSPRAHYAVPAYKAIVYDYMDAGWRALRMDDLQNERILELVVKGKKTIHQSGISFAYWSVFEEIGRLMHSVSRAKADTPARLPHDFWWLLTCVYDIEPVMSAAGMGRKPCQADGLASNIMIHESGQLRFVDFDMFCSTDPYYDLGILLNEGYQFEDEMCAAIEIYEGGFRRDSLFRCRLYAIADDLMWGLWSILMDMYSPRRDIEFLKYANWRFLRCRMALHDPRLEFMLRKI